MEQFERKFTSFVNGSLKILFFIILAKSVQFAGGVCIKLWSGNPADLILVNLSLIAGCIGISYLVYTDFKAHKNVSRTLAVILVVALLLRIAWLLTVNSKPFSDFAVVYDTGRQFADGDYAGFMGMSYLARFPHLTVTAIYFGMFQKVFADPYIAIKLVNSAYSLINVYIIFLIGSEVYGDREKGLWAALLASLFPPFIMYNSVFCSENVAMPFFLGSVYVFILVAIGKKRAEWLLLSGLLLSAGNLFRMVAYVIVIAYLMYLAVYHWDKKRFVKSCGFILVSFFVPLYITNAVLMGAGITENPLWKGREPSITSVLKGTNVEHNGMWNSEDSKIPALYNYDYKAVEAASKSIIMKRLTTTPFYRLAGFYITKFSTQWSAGDFSGLSWSTYAVISTNAAVFLSKYSAPFYQLLFVLVLLSMFAGLFNRRQFMENKIVNLFYIIFCGYGLLYLITEQQPRYGYIISWVFVILTFTSAEKCLLLAEKIKLMYSPSKQRISGKQETKK